MRGEAGRGTGTARLARWVVAAALAGISVAGCRRAKPDHFDPAPASSASAPAPKRVTWRASFTVSATKLTIEDTGMSNRLDRVLAGTSGTLVLNGGFFGKDGHAEGLAISEGTTLSAFSPRMSGGVLWIRDGVAHLSATEDYDAGAVDFAIQCRPRLVVGGRVNVRSDDGRRARRTALCLRDGGRTIEIDLAIGDDEKEGPTLVELATELAGDGCQEALNLDGGPSTGFAFRGDAEVAFTPPRGPVRHAIVVR